MNEHQYQSRLDGIIRKNWLLWGLVTTGIAGIAIGAKICINNLDVSYLLKYDLSKDVSNFLQYAIMMNSLGLTMREFSKRGKLEEEYQSQFRKR